MRSLFRMSTIALALVLTFLLLFSCDNTPREPKWTPNNSNVTNKFVEDTSVDFSALFDGSPETKVWKYVTSDGTTITDSDYAALYIVEVDKGSASRFFDFAFGSFNSANLSIMGFKYNKENKNNAYLLILRYPDNFIHDWSIECFWHDGSKWNYTRSVQTDEDMVPIWHKDITDAKLATFYDEMKEMGTITRIYQFYKGDDPYLVEGTKYEFVVEYSSAHPNLQARATNSKGKYIGHTTSSWAGALREDTVAYVYLTALPAGDPTLRATILVYDTAAQEWYNSYYSLPLVMEGGKLKIDGVFLVD